MILRLKIVTTEKQCYFSIAGWRCLFKLLYFYWIYIYLSLIWINGTWCILFVVVGFLLFICKSIKLFLQIFVVSLISMVAERAQGAATSENTCWCCFLFAVGFFVWVYCEHLQRVCCQVDEVVFLILGVFFLFASHRALSATLDKSETRFTIKFD